MDDTERLRAALDAMVRQFGHREEFRGRRYLSTMGLSALEDAFAALGWTDDPHDVTEEEPGCQWPDCTGWTSCGLNTNRGYRVLCEAHCRRVMGGERVPDDRPDDQSPQTA